MTTLEATITAVATRCLHGHPAGRSHPAAIDLDTPFELLGLDSLATIELAAALEDELGCEVPADVLVDCTDARSLAARLARLGVGGARGRTIRSTRWLRTRCSPTISGPQVRACTPTRDCETPHDPPDRRHRIPRLGAARGTARHVKRDDRVSGASDVSCRYAGPRRAASAPSPATCRILASA